MSVKSRTLCKWSKKDIKAHLDTFLDRVRQPRFLCRKCGRVAASRKDVCKPLDMKGKP